MNSELWVDIEGYEGLYQVSNHGQVRRLHKLLDSAHFEGVRKPRKILKPNADSSGRLSVSLSKNGICTRHRVHRLVLIAFVGEKPYPEFECRHLDGNNQNNRLDNLAWGTHLENEADKLLHGTRHNGLPGKSVKLNAESVKIIRKSEQSSYELASLFDVNPRTIRKIRERRIWKHVGD